MQPGNWLATPLGRRCLSHEQRLVRRVLDRVFGEQMLQVGTWGATDLFLRHARTQRVALLDVSAGTVADTRKPSDTRKGSDTQRMSATGEAPPTPYIVSALDRIAIATDSIDAILLPHTLECTDSPHAVLREAARVLRPDGCLIVLGFRPTGLWGLRHLMARGGYPTGCRHQIRVGRLHDWLELLSFDVDAALSYCHTLPFEGVRRFGTWPRERFAKRWLPMLAGGYLTVARKRAINLTPIRPAWKRPRLRAVGSLVEPTTRVSRRSSN
jgi:SAM-dependent methyltransferase